MKRLFRVASCGLCLSAMTLQPASADWRVRIDGVATPYVYDSSFFRPTGPDVPIIGSVVWRQLPCDSWSPRGNFHVTKVDLDIDRGRETYACDETDPNAINWSGTPDGACDYGTNMLDFGLSSALVRGLAAPTGGPSAGDATTDLWAAFTGGGIDRGTCAVEPPSSADLRTGGNAVIMTHAYNAPQGTVTSQYVFTSGTLTFEPYTPPAVQPEAQIVILRDEVEGFGLDQELGASLRAKLNAAIAALSERDNSNSACGLLGAFSNQAHAQSGNRIPADVAAHLVTGASTIGNQLGCR